VRATRRSAARLVALLAVALLGLPACGGSSSSAEGCEDEASVVFWGGTQWVELATALAAEPAECTEYYVTVPPQDADKTKLRGRGAFEEIRALDPHVHPVAEIRFTSEAGWRAWAEKTGTSFYDAGVEARRRMSAAGLDGEAGELWALNELDAEVRENAAGRRDEVREFLRGLYEGGDDLPEARGIVFDLGSFTAPDVAAYKASLQKWLSDSAFWEDLDQYVDYYAEEVYTGPQAWAVEDASLDERTASLNEFLYHVPALAEAGPESVDAAREFLARTYVPLANAAWPHALIAETNLVSAEEMAAFVSGEVYAMRQKASESDDVPDALGFAWAPNPAEPSYSDAGRDTVLNRLAAAIRDSASDSAAACEAEGRDWCDGAVAGAALDERWKAFATWD
jgi:hypothetical protein